MQLQLAPKGPPVWFLGEPKKIKFMLNFQAPGPVEVDFAALTFQEQKQILTSLRLGHIISDLPLHVLLATHESTKPKEVPPPSVQQFLAQQNRSKKEDLLLKQKASQEARDQQIAKRCAYLITQSVKAIKTVVSKTDDIRLLRALLATERQAKNRATITSYIEAQLRKIQQEIATKVEEAAKSPPLRLSPEPGTTFSKDVIDSESKVITLSEQDIVDLAAGRKLGGDL